MAGIGRARTSLIALGGIGAVLGLYWDDAWHTDVGRDAFFSPPHLFLYAGVGLLLVAAMSLAVQRYRHEGWTAFRHLTLTLPLLGAAVTLAAAPVDELWHELFGRDAVVWSPPHMVAAAGMLAFAAGLYLASHRDAERTSCLTTAVIGAFLLAAAGTIVMEYEADVPQFPVITYLPVHIASLTFAFALLRRGLGRAWAATHAAAVYVLLRVVVVVYLALLGHSLPTVMPTRAGYQSTNRHQVKESVLYPPPPSGTPLGQLLTGVLLYALAIVILAAVGTTYRRATVPLTA